MTDAGLEVRTAEYYSHHSAGVYQGGRPGKLRGLAHADQSIHRVSLLAVQASYVLTPTRNPTSVGSSPMTSQSIYNWCINIVLVTP